VDVIVVIPPPAIEESVPTPPALQFVVCAEAPPPTVAVKVAPADIVTLGSLDAPPPDVSPVIEFL
jgi:hypothetical protein